jgi:hypothetical protein
MVAITESGLIDGGYLIWNRLVLNMNRSLGIYLKVCVQIDTPMDSSPTVLIYFAHHSNGDLFDILGCIQKAAQETSYPPVHGIFQQSNR